MSYKPPSSRRMRRPLRKTKVVAPAPPEPKVSVEEIQAILDEEPEVAPEPEVAHGLKLINLDELETVLAEEGVPKLVVTIDELEAVLAEEIELEVEVETSPSVETPPVEAVEEADPEQAREDDGTFAADDPETPEVNEAFVEGEPTKTWSKRDNKAVLLEVAAEGGLTDLTDENNTKAEIVAALEAAGL